MTNFLKKTMLFNENGSDSFESQDLIGGNPTGIANLNNVRYGWMNTLHREMLANFWIPERVNLTDDKTSVRRLSKDEDEAVQGTLGFLIFLDNYQVANLPNIGDFLTNPMARNLIALQTQQEVIHSASYQYILEALYPSVTRDRIYNMWRDDPVLLARNKSLGAIGQQLIDNPTEENFIRICFANLALEGVFFYQGFNFFDQLAHRQKLVQTAIIIDYIRKDEFTHVGLFVNIINAIANRISRERLVEIAHEVMSIAAESEIKWCKHRYGNKILGITEGSSEQYVKYLVNDRLRRCGIPPLFEGDISNPYAYIENSQKAGGSRKNFFESAAVSEYDTAESVPGWDNL